MTSRRKLVGTLAALAMLVAASGVVVGTTMGVAGAAVGAQGDDHDDADESEDNDKKKDKKNDKKKDNDEEGDSESESAESTIHEDAQRENGMAIQDSTGGREPTDEDQENADAFYESVVDGIGPYADLQIALDDGYVEGENSAGLNVKHYMKRGVNGAELDPAQPSGLVYYVDENQATLLGAVWVTQDNEPPQPGGPLTVWHDHSPMGCPETNPDCPLVTGEETDGVPPLMFHVWTFEDAVDVFAHGFPDAVGADGGGRSEGERPPLPFDV